MAAPPVHTTHTVPTSPCPRSASTRLRRGHRITVHHGAPRAFTPTPQCQLAPRQPTYHAGFFGHLVQGFGSFTARMMKAEGFACEDIPVGNAWVRLWEAPGTGDRGTVVVIHGLGSQTGDYRALLNKLRPHAKRVISIDLPGHGGSGPLGEHHGAPPAQMYECLERCVAQVNEALEIALGKDCQVTLLGHSSGGYFASRFALAAQRKNALYRMVLVSTDGGPFTPQELATLRQRLDMQSRADAVAMAHDLWPNARVKAHFMAPFLRAIFRAPAMRYLVYSDFMQPLLTPAQLHALPPVTLVWGTEERVQAPNNLPYLREHLPPDSEVVCPKGIGHGALPDAPSALLEPIVAAIEGRSGLA